MKYNIENWKCNLKTECRKQAVNILQNKTLNVRGDERLQEFTRGHESSPAT